MRKFMILGSVVALVVAALALPALAQQEAPFRFAGDEDLQEEHYEGLWDVFEARYEDQAGWGEFEEEGFFAFDEDFDGNRFFGEDDIFGDEGFFFFGDEDRFDDGGFEGEDFGAGVSQGFEQEAQSGDVGQSFDVSSTGGNSNQCAGVQGVANTGNAQNQVGVLQYGSEAGDFEFEGSGASIEVSPVNATSCDQAVNQAASASGR